jgi:hypothetical protein
MHRLCCSNTSGSAVLGVLAAAALSACGSGSDSATQIDRCVDRLLERAAVEEAQQAGARRYARDTYCARFERKGWIHEDGTLKIDAHVWLEGSRTCATAGAGEPARTVPCDEVEDDEARLDCALLHHVRRSEVAAYLERLQRDNLVACDDGTPLDELGVP